MTVAFTDALAPHAIDLRTGLWRRVRRNPRMMIGGTFVLGVLLLCVLTLPATLNRSSPLYYDAQNAANVRMPPALSVVGLLGYDALGRSILARCLLGGAVSLLIGVVAAAIAVAIGTFVGMIAGYAGGWTDALLMRGVDILYGLPYILLVVLLKVAIEDRLAGWLGSRSALTRVIDVTMASNLFVLFLALGLVSWLTMSRVVRGQVLTLREMPFIEAGRAMGLPRRRLFLRHALPNLVGPITVYATLAVPAAILQESFLSFLGVGVRLPLPTWGNLASEGVAALTPVKFYWWMLTFPCLLLMATLLSLNFLGDGLRDLIDTRSDAAKL